MHNFGDGAKLGCLTPTDIPVEAKVDYYDGSTRRRLKTVSTTYTIVSGVDNLGGAYTVAKLPKTITTTLDDNSAPLVQTSSSSTHPAAALSGGAGSERGTNDEAGAIYSVSLTGG